MTYLKKILSEEVIEKLTQQLQRTEIRLSDTPVCDFCGDSLPMFVYAATRMSTGEPTACWRWCACTACSDAIDMADWVGLKSRVVVRMESLLPKGTPDYAILRAVDRALHEFHITAINVPVD